MKFYDFYKLDDFNSKIIFLITALTILLILYCIFCYASDNNAIMIAIRDCENLNTNIVYLKNFLIISKLI